MLACSLAMSRGRCLKITRETSLNSTNVILMTYLGHPLTHDKISRTNIEFCSAYHPSLKYTFEISESSLSFLDLCLTISDARITTTIHYKPTDTQSYLEYSSSHPPHCKKAIPYGQFLRLRRICSDDDVYDWLNPRKWHRSLRTEDILVVSVPTAKGEPRGSAAKEHSAIPNEETEPDVPTKYL